MIAFPFYKAALAAFLLTICTNLVAQELILLEEDEETIQLRSQVTSGMFLVIHGRLDRRYKQIYIFPLIGTKTELVFVSCPFVELSDGTEEWVTVCRIEWVDGTGDILHLSRTEGVSGCSIEDYGNIECPDFMEHGNTYATSRDLAASLQKTYPLRTDFLQTDTPTNAILPLALAVREISGFADHIKERYNAFQSGSFEIFENCRDYSGESALRAACKRAVGALTDETPVLGFVAMTVGKQEFVCVVTKGWSIQTCGRAMWTSPSR